jgi:4'-phosphopantetheinyl transferase
VHPDPVRVELATPDAMASESERAAALAILSPGERERAARMRVPAARDAWLLAHALARKALAREAGVAPEVIELAAGARGKPEVAGPAAARALRFNLSHTDGLAAVALARGAAVGVDVEARDREIDALALAARFFAPAETDALRALDGAARRARFVALWTLKEALLKALGVGIAGGLARAAFDAAADPPRLLPGELAGEPARWQLELHAPTSRHVLALAVERAPGTVREVVWGRSAL